MALVQTDRTKSENLEPIVLKPKTINTYKDNATLEQNELQVATDIVLDNGYIEKALGTVKVNSDNASAACYGFHRAYGLASERVAIRLANGTLKSGLSAFSTTVLSNLASLVTPFINAPNGKSYGVNTTDGVIRYNPATVEGLKTGIIGPYLRKQVAFFESTETWSTNLGASQSSDYYRPDEWTGFATKSLKLVVSAAGGSCGSSATFNLDLSQFANTKTSDSDDYIAFHTFHLVRDDFDRMTVEFSTGDTAFTTKKLVTLYRGDCEENDYQWTFWKVKKSAFLDTGSPDWATVKATRIYAYAATGKTTTFYVDFMHLRITQLRVKELRKLIAGCNQSETWTNVAGGSISFDNQIYAEGFCSLKQTTTGRNYRTVALDLTKWTDNSTVQASDEIALQARLTARTNFTKLKLMVCKTSAVYYAHDILPADIPANSQWFDIATSLSNFSAVGGMSAWGTVTRIDLSATLTGACTLNVDDIRLQPHTVQKQLVECEASETWAFDHASISTKKQGVVQGTGCLLLKGYGAVMKQSTGTVTLSASRNLTTWDDGTASNTDDLICFNLYHAAIKAIDYLLVYFGDADLSDYYYYQINKTEFATQGQKGNSGKEIQIAKSKFTAVGSPNWAAILAARFTSQAKSLGDIYIDDVTMKRQGGVTGRYYYKYLYKFKDIPSAFSEISEYVDAKGGYISLSLIKSSVDSRITSKEIYRLGGDYPGTWYRVGDVPNATEDFVDKLNDSDLTYLLSADVPAGNINDIPCSNLVYDSKSDRILYWGNTSYRDRVYASNPIYYHVVSETSYRSFPGEVMGVIPWHGQTIVICRDRVVRVDGEFLTGDMIEITVPMGGCSYYCADRISEGLIVYAGMDNVYLLDGYKAFAIGDEVQDYFTGRESYLSSVYTKFFAKEKAVYIAVKDKTGTPTYNSKVLRYYVPTKSWTVLTWNANLFALLNGQGDDNSLWYADSLATTGDVVKTGSSTHQYKAGAISSEAKTGWFNDPLAELSMRQIELKAKGTGTLTVTGYKNLSEAAAAFTGAITLSSSWVTYTILNPLLERSMTGDHLELKFTHPTDNAGFELKDITIYMQKMPKRRTLSEVTIS
jgi:hypothetical protein